ncbi:hypothetical protein JG688_00001043 [Phytophthora aleatoria]|uniref:Uncharacterized protein n=1 Tax=Phytophthora aleatoria TaxID=2496075 RepID=A0A8J5MDJ5_9STRA|nr:hypothetical protein JG688_00001043 [Phytophthora aleatoria]
MMNVPLSQWTAPKVSRLWSAKGDDRCSPPRSDDYKDWTLMQLKREITQRQLKTNPRRRNKDAFVRVLLSNDQEQAQIQTQNAPQNQQQTLEDTIPAQMQTPMAVAAPAPETLETEVEAPQSFEASKRQRVEQTEHESEGTRLEIESRRLDIETKREQRNSELHAVQLALANEQLQQAKMTTQKMKTEWMVEQ